MLSTLCDRCKALEFDDTALGGYKADSESDGFYLEIQDPRHANRVHIDYHLTDNLPDLEVLTRSVKDGCGFCSLLRACLREHSPSTAKQVEVGLLYQWNPRSSTSDLTVGLTHLKARITFDGLDDGAHTIYLHFGIFGPPGKTTEWLRLEPSSQPEVLCDENIDWVTQHLEKTSDLYWQPSSKAYYPTRLVYIGDVTSNICYVVDTESDSNFGDNAMRHKYIALSYCWGSPVDATKQSTTTRASLQSRRAGFHFDTLSPVIQDAITAARAFKVQYLWIDALCIVQEDHADWDNESARMSLIFQHAYLTICAAGSDSCQEGFLRRKETATVPFQSKIDENVNGYYELRSPGVQQSEASSRSYPPWFLDLFKNRWSSRAWTFQELRMSKRVLLFGLHKIHFLTADSLYSETTDKLPVLKTTTCSSYVDIGRALTRNENAEWDWFRRELIEQFARKKLTKESDKLAAFSGIASLAFQGHPDQYVAGMSRQQLHIELFWRNEFRFLAFLSHYTTPLTRKELIDRLEGRVGYIAPSWSWASSNNNIDFSQLSFDLHNKEWLNIRKEYLEAEVHISLEGVNPFGRITDGTLLLTGTILPLPLDVQPPPDASPGRQMADFRHQAKEGDKIIAFIDFDWDVLLPEDHIKTNLDDMFFVLIGSTTDQYSWDIPSDDETDDELKLRNELDAKGNLQGKDEDNNSSRDNDDSRSGNESEEFENDDKEVYEESSKLKDGYLSEIHEESTDRGPENDFLKMSLNVDDQDDATKDCASTTSDESYKGSNLSNSTVSWAYPSESNQYAYGIVVYKSKKLNKYFRIGIFSSWPETGGGLAYFRAGNVEKIEII